MSGGFGRKGVEPGQAIPASRMQGFGRNGGQAAHEQFDDLTAKREAFIASERGQSTQGQSEMDGLRNKNAPEPRQQLDAKDIAQHFGPTPSHVLGTERPLWGAYLLWFFLGQLSIHRFYLGATQSAFCQLGLFFGSIISAFLVPFVGIVGFCVWCIWIVADLFLMPGLHRQLSRFSDPSLSFT